LRKFYLINGAGIRLNLNDPKSLFFQNPAGLGMAKTLTYNTSGTGFFGLSKETANQINVVGDIVITTLPYGRFRNLIDFLTITPLVLEYAPTNAGTYFLDVDLEYITKTELKAGVLTCPVSFKGKGLWRRSTPTVIRIERPAELDEPSIYPFAYPYQYGILPDRTKILTAGGHIPAALEVQVTGEIKNPVITLTKGSTVIGKMVLATTVPSGKKLVFSSKYNGESGVWIDGEDASQYIVLSQSSFFRLPPNTQGIITVEGDEPFDGSVIVTVHSYYAAV